MMHTLHETAKQLHDTGMELRRMEYSSYEKEITEIALDLEILSRKIKQDIENTMDALIAEVSK